MRDFHLPGRSPVLADGGMAATSHPLAARVAVETLARGGNAVDAAIAAAVLLGLCEPQMTGLGGDAFALLKPGNSDAVIGLNGSGRAPAGMTADRLRARGLDAVPTEGAEAVTLPGAVDAFCRLSERFGRLGLEDALAPVIPYFEAGVPVAPRVAFDWAEAAGRLTGAARTVYLRDGAALATGDRFALPGQAEVLRRIAREGRAGFYEGPVAEDVAASLRAAGGVHAAEDLAAVEATWTDPISGPVGGPGAGAELWEHPPNGQGATALLMAAILERLDVARLDPLGVARAHLEAEAAKLAYDARDRFIADPDHTAALAHMTAASTADALAGLIDPRRAMRDPRAASDGVHGAGAGGAGGGGAPHRDTVYVTVVDRDRMAVSLIYSIFHSFGSGLATDRFGILLQNRGAGFSLAPGHPNEMAPGKRPMHTIIPAMLRSGAGWMPFGVMGGAYQPNGHVRVAHNLLHHGMDPQAAIDAPRAFADGGVLKVERGYPEAVRTGLAALGHDVQVPGTPIGGAQAIRIAPEGHLEGASDPRKDGCALGH